MGNPAKYGTVRYLAWFPIKAHRPWACSKPLERETMATKNASLGTSGNQSKDHRTPRGRSGRESAHNDSSTEEPNNSPLVQGQQGNQSTHGVGYFLSWLHPETPIDPEVLERKWLYFSGVPDHERPDPDDAPVWDEQAGLERWEK